MYPQQPSDNPNQGGRHPGDPHAGGQYPGGQGPAPQNPGDQYSPRPEQYGGYPPPAPGAPGAGPAKMPGAAVAVRVLMFIGGACGLLLGGLMWLGAAMATSGGQAGEEMRRTMEQTGLPMSGAEAGAFFGLMGAIPFVYGVVSIVLASFMGRRSPAILWSVVVFQGLAALVLVANLFTGGFASVIPLAFTVTMIVLMLLEGTRAYYSRPAPSSY